MKASISGKVVEIHENIRRDSKTFKKVLEKYLPIDVRLVVVEKSLDFKILMEAYRG